MKLHTTVEHDAQYLELIPLEDQLSVRIGDTDYVGGAHVITGWVTLDNKQIAALIEHLQNWLEGAQANASTTTRD